MFFKETCFFFLKGLEKDTFQGQTVKWQQRNSSNQNYSLGVAYLLIHSKRSLCCQGQKMAGFLLKTKIDTSLESAFQDLHVDATFVILPTK